MQQPATSIRPTTLQVSNPRNHARSWKHELVAASTATVVKSQGEFTLSQGKITRAKEEVNSQTRFWLHLANLC